MAEKQIEIADLNRLFESKFNVTITFQKPLRPPENLNTEKYLTNDELPTETKLDAN